MNEIAGFAERLKELRTKNNISQRQMAEQLGITAPTISAYEAGTKSPSLLISRKIASMYNISLDWLAGLDNSDQFDILNIRKYSDIIRVFLKLDETENINIEFGEVSLKNPESFNNIRGYGIFFNNGVIADFIKEWERMRNLYKIGTIDTDIYSLWIEKSLTKYNYFLDSEQIKE